jgi:hypothetical protein
VPAKDSQKRPADIHKRPSDSSAQPEAPQNEFQRFVAASLGHSLPMFGYSLFSRVPSTFAQADRIPVTADYVVGPGDEILVRAWDQIEVDARVVVDRGGDIYLAKIGSLHVAGPTSGSAVVAARIGNQTSSLFVPPVRGEFTKGQQRIRYLIDSRAARSAATFGTVVVLLSTPAVPRDEVD